jgi:phage-related protein
MADDRRRRRTKTFADRLRRPAPARAAAAAARARPAARAAAAGSATSSAATAALRRPDPGRPLEPAVRRRLEDGFGRPLDHVRIHAAAHDRQLARSERARAFAHRHHIWLGPHESPSDVALLAHEVAHVAQQGYAPAPPAGAAAGVPGAAAVARPVPLHGAGSAARRGGGAGAAPARAAGRSAAAVQRWGLPEIDVWGAARRAGGAVASGVRSAAGAVAEVAGDLLSMARDELLGIVRRIAPDFLPLFEGGGIAKFIRSLVERGLRSLFDGLLGPLRGVLNFGAIGQRVSQALAWIGTIAGQLARNDCSGILAAARRVGAFFSSALQPVLDKIRAASDAVSGFFRGIWEAIGVPVLDILKRIGGTIWDSLKGFVRDAAAVIRRVREALGKAWQRVKGWLGIGAEDGEHEGGGLWEWIKQKASAVGESISRVIRPVIGPLRTVGGVLLLLTPGMQVLGIVLLWPRLKAAWNQLSQKWESLQLIPRARHYLATTVLPAVMGAAEAVGQALVGAADWLLGMVDRVGTALATALRAATGILSPLGRLIGWAHAQFQRLINWARGGLRYVSRNMRMLLGKLVHFLGVVLEAMKRLIAIAVNPFGIVGFLLGSLWRLIPDCLKGPIIDFILEIIIRLLRAMPPMPTMGPLWPLVKSAALGFLERVKSYSMQRKVNVSIKLARIVSGMSPSFAFGYLKGIALGVWDGITAPFQAIATVFDLPDMIQNFLSNLGIRLCDLVESIRCFAANLASRVFGSLDKILAGLAEILENPRRILELIKCAIEGALSAAASLGASIADQMMAVFESPDEEIGERLGHITGNMLVQAVITYFTAGAGAAVGVIREISSALGAVGRAIGQVVKTLTQLLGKLVGFLRGLASRFASAVARGARSVLGKLGGWFKKVAAWFRKLLGRLFRFLKKRFMLTAEERALWFEFKGEVQAALLPHQEAGITRSALRGIYRPILRSHKKVAKWPAFFTKHGPKWRLWVRRVKSLRPRVVGHAMLDRDSRWKQGKKAVKKAVKRLKRMPGNIDAGMIDAALIPTKIKYLYRDLSARFLPSRNEFEIDGAMSPGLKVIKTPPKRPTQNSPRMVLTASKHLKINELVKKSAFRSAATGTPPLWRQVEKIKTRGGSTSLYRKGHLISGHFTSGDSANLTPITFSANALMASGAESPVRRALPVLARSSGRQPIFSYEVNATGTGGGVSPNRKFKELGVWKCKPVAAEKQLVRNVHITVTKKAYNPSSHKWDRVVPGQSPPTIPNVGGAVGYPRGWKEPCKYKP